jgi:hypothetical protein
MNTQQAVQELKSERVQQELIAEEPFRISLKSERVQEEIAAVGGRAFSLYELSFNQMGVVTIDLPELRAVVTLHAPGGPQAA